MAWVEKTHRNGQAVYLGRYRDADGRKRTAGVDRRKREALRTAREQEARSRERARNRAAGILTLREYFDEHWYPNRRTEINTRARYQTHFRAGLGPAFGETPLAEITSSAIQGWVTTMIDQGVSPGNHPRPDRPPPDDPRRPPGCLRAPRRVHRPKPPSRASSSPESPDARSPCSAPPRWTG